MPWASSAAAAVGEQPRTGPGATPKDWLGPAPSPPAPPPSHTDNLSHAALEPTLFPKLRVQFADFPYLHCSYRAEAVHLGDLMRLSVRHSVEFQKAGKVSRAVDGELDAGKTPALYPCTRVSPDNRIPHSAHTQLNRKDNSAQCHRRRVRRKSRRRVSTSVCGNFNPLPFRPFFAIAT